MSDGWMDELMDEWMVDGWTGQWVMDGCRWVERYIDNKEVE